MRPTGTPVCMIAVTASMAARRSGKPQRAAAICSGSGCSLRPTSVTMPSVPSAPVNRCVRS